MQRPNKLRVELFKGKVICDGKQWYAFCDAVPGQVVLREAPAKLNMDVLRADDLLYSALSDGEQAHVAPTPIAVGRRSDQEPDEWLAGCRSRRAGPAWATSTVIASA